MLVSQLGNMTRTKLEDWIDMIIFTKERIMRSFRNAQVQSLNMCKVCFLLATKHCSNECVPCKENVKLIRTNSQYTGIASNRKRKR